MALICQSRESGSWRVFQGLKRCGTPSHKVGTSESWATRHSLRLPSPCPDAWPAWALGSHLFSGQNFPGFQTGQGEQCRECGKPLPFAVHPLRAGV